MSDGLSPSNVDFTASLLIVADRLELLYQLKEQGKLEKTQYYLIPLLEIYLFTILSQVEVLTYDKAARLAKSQWEVNMCYCFCEIVFGEGMTYFFGFDKNGQNKHFKTKELNSYLTTKKLGNEIIAACNSFFEKCKNSNLFLDLKRDKNISKHFDLDYTNVIDHYVKANSDVNRARANLYFKWLTELNNLIEQFITDNQIVIYADSRLSFVKKEIKGVIIPQFQDYDVILKKIEMGEKQLIADYALFKNHSERINHLCCNDLRYDYSAVVLFKQCKTATELFKSCCHIQFVELSICYAIKAYAECTDNMEKQINLYRILLAYYEGFKKLYGFNDRKDNTLLYALNQFIVPLNDETLRKKYTDIDTELHKQIGKAKRYESTRNIITHNKDDNKDCILEKIYSLVKINPTELLCDAGLLLSITRPLMELTDTLAQQYLPEYWKP